MGIAWSDIATAGRTEMHALGIDGPRASSANGCDHSLTAQPVDATRNISHNFWYVKKKTLPARRAALIAVN
jgi:hypothetical protein